MHSVQKAAGQKNRLPRNGVTCDLVDVRPIKYCLISLGWSRKVNLRCISSWNVRNCYSKMGNCSWRAPLKCPILRKTYNFVIMEIYWGTNDEHAEEMTKRRGKNGTTAQKDDERARQALNSRSQTARAILPECNRSNTLVICKHFGLKVCSVHVSHSMRCL